MKGLRTFAFYITSLFGVIGVISCAAAEAFSGKTFTLDQAINIALENNPALKAKKAEWQSFMERLPQAKALPDPKVGIDTWNIPEDISIGKTGTTLFWVSQKFPYPGKLKLRGELVSKEAEVSKVLWKKAEIDLIAKVSRSYHELLYIDNVTAITQESKKLADRFVKVIKTLYSVGKSNRNDLLTEQSHIDLLAENLVLLADLRNAETARINALLGMPPSSPAGRPEDIEFAKPVFDADDFFRAALENRHELLIDSLEIGKSMKQLELAKKESYPDFDIRLRRFQNYRSSDGYGLLMGLTVPLWPAKNRARIKEAMNRVEALTYKKQDDENRTRADIKKEFFELNNSLRFIRLYRESLIPRAQESIEAAEAVYRTGRASFLDLYNAQNDLLNYNVIYRKLIRDYGFAAARLEQIIGRRLNM